LVYLLDKGTNFVESSTNVRSENKMSRVSWKALLASPAILGASLLVSTSAIAAEAETAGSVADFSETKNTSALSTPVAAKVEDSKTLLALEPKPGKPAASIPVSQLEAAPQEQLPAKGNSLAQVTSVSELSDVQPTDWAFQAVQSLVERYACIEGYPDRTFRGNRAATRYELAAALNACLNQISAQLGGLTAEDLATIKRLQDEFAAELATLRGRVDALEARTDELEANQFSTTAKLTGEVIFQPSGVTGDFADIAGDTDTDINSNIFLGYRARLNFDASFTGEDRLRVRLSAADTSVLGTGVTGTNMTRLNVDTDSDNIFEIDDLYYRFPLADIGNVYIAAANTEFYDAIETFNPYLESEGQGALSRFGRFNPIYRQVETGTGAIINLDFNDAFGVSVGYLAPTGDATDAVADAADPDAGLFGGQYAALAQIGITPSDVFSLGLTYVHAYYPSGALNLTGSTGSQLAQNPLGVLDLEGRATADHFGIELNVQPSPRFSFGGWVGYSLAHAVDGPADGADVNLLNYAVNIALPDLGREGNMAAIIFGQPPKIVGGDLDEDGTSYHIEGLYRIAVTDNISITPGAFVILNAENNNDNNPVYVGTVRTTFTF
jgi:hypothetical protein